MTISSGSGEPEQFAINQMITHIVILYVGMHVERESDYFVSL